MLPEKLPFAELRNGKFRQHPQRLVMADISLPVDMIFNSLAVFIAGGVLPQATISPFAQAFFHFRFPTLFRLRRTPFPPGRKIDERRRLGLSVVRYFPNPQAFFLKLSTL
ncbi:MULTISPECIES: hypothetical protein [Methylomonas]|uniref:hypothetical protein n=1 Tax=Methylomonas TaxID=416 RepID=UPI0012F67288|nr:hypothetical protein [Methylomonas koyamae]